MFLKRKEREREGGREERRKKGREEGWTSKHRRWDVKEFSTDVSVYQYLSLV